MTESTPPGSAAPDNTPAFGRPMLAEWLLDPAITHLNHGTVGATPRCVLAVQQALRTEIERNPAHFMLRELSHPFAGEPHGRERRLRRAAREVAAYFGARGEDCVFIDNTTTAVNAVLQSLTFREGDEILLLDHTYGAVRNAADYVARRSGALVRSAQVPFPCPGPEAVVDAVRAALSPRTRIAIIDHVTSISALVLPVAAIAALCRAQGVPVLVDGAHATGAFALDIPALGVDWYTGNLHKWGWAPRSCALLWVDPARQAELHPTTVSWGLDQGLCAEFDWVGTRDPTPYLAAPAGLAFMRELGLERVFRYNHALAWQAGVLLAERWGTPLPAPESMIGTMVCARLPDAAGATHAQGCKLRDVLLFEAGIELPIQLVADGLWVRISAQIYNEISDIELLASALAARL